MRSENRLGELPEAVAPAVIGGGEFTEHDETIDASDQVVFVPAHPGTDGRESTVRFELRKMSDGRPAMLAFTSAERLVEGLGEVQPWLSMNMDRLRTLTAVIGIDTICVDPQVKPGTGRWTEDDLKSFLE